VLIVTEKAADKAKSILTDEGKTQHGIRIFIAGSGCCGPSYGLNIEETHKPEDEVVETNGLKIFLDKETSMNLADKQLDYYIGAEGEGFVFTGGASACGSGCSGCGE
jgi:iron-sulfur cluster assembly accessory protein